MDNLLSLRPSMRLHANHSLTAVRFPIYNGMVFHMVATWLLHVLLLSMCRLERGLSAMCAVLGVPGLPLHEDAVAVTLADVTRAVADVACTSEACRTAACRYTLCT